MQVDPIKPTLKPPGTRRLKVHDDEPPSNVSFTTNLRRYTEEAAAGAYLHSSASPAQPKPFWSMNRFVFGL